MRPKHLVLFPLSCLMLVTFVIVRGQTSVTVPYIKPMLIGRTFDVSKSNIGGDIFDRNTIRLKEIQNFLVTSKFKMVKTKKQVRDVLDVSGQLSLQIMAGMVDVKGEGRYLKATTGSSSFVEVLAKITFQTITETIDNVPTLRPGWNVNPIGQHFVRGITYGGYLIASLKFEAKSEKDKELIEARVEANIQRGTGSIGVEGQFKKLAESASDVSTLSISYTATVPLKDVPTDIDSLIKAIKDFPDLVKSSTRGGNGVPIEAHLLPLSELDKHIDPKLQFLIDGTTQTSLDALNSKYFDLISTIAAINSFGAKYRLLTDKAEQDLGKLNDRVFQVLYVFNQVIASLDLRKSASQFNKAYNAYKEGKSGFTGKFMREFNKMMIDKRKMVLNPPDPVAYKKNGILYLSANNSYTAVAQAAKVAAELANAKMERHSMKKQLEGIEERFLSVYIKSEGCNDPRPPNSWCQCSIKVNGKEYAVNWRGHNIVVVNSETGVITDRKVFDTFLGGSHTTNMKNFINSLPKRRLVLVAVKDSAEALTKEAIASLESIGGSNIKITHRSSYALLGWTGPGALDAVTQVQRPSAKGPSIIAKVISFPL